jgi:hypothetical protein
MVFERKVLRKIFCPTKAIIPVRETDDRVSAAIFLVELFL